MLMSRSEMVQNRNKALLSTLTCNMSGTVVAESSQNNEQKLIVIVRRCVKVSLHGRTSDAVKKATGLIKLVKFLSLIS